MRKGAIISISVSSFQKGFIITNVLNQAKNQIWEMWAPYWKAELENVSVCLLLCPRLIFFTMLERLLEYSGGKPIEVAC